MSNSYYKNHRKCNILREGDVAKFITIGSRPEDITYQGIIIEVARPNVDGNITYTVFCDDNVTRVFGDYEAIEEICLIGSSGIN